MQIVTLMYIDDYFLKERIGIHVYEAISLPQTRKVDGKRI